MLALVSLDIAGILAAFVLQLFTCEGHVTPAASVRAAYVLEILSLVFCCLFVLELSASGWVFGKQYFRSGFHCLDAAVILVGFIINVLLKGVLEEIGSLVVVDELSAGAEEQVAIMEGRIDALERENESLRIEVDALKGNEYVNLVES